MKKPPDSKFLGDATAAILSGKRNAALRGTLFRKYLVLFIGLVSAALLLNAAVELSFQYRDLLAPINNVLDLAKIEAGQLVLAIDDYHPVELVQSVVSSMEALARMKGLSFACRTEGNIPPARGDVQRLRQVLVNLVGNAIKFIDAGGVEVTTSVVDGRLRIAVRDSGPGISPQDHEFVFEEFRQLDNSSTRTKGGGGLGLPIARQIVELHGGRLTLVSTSGQGATFVIDIPVRVAATAEMAP